MQASTGGGGGGGGGDINPALAAAALNTSHMLGAAATDQSHHHQQHQQVEAASPISSRPPMDEFMHLSSAGTDDDALGAAGDEPDRGGVSGNRWPRQETLALLRIRSEMDSNFRDATLKGPLWEDVSRKLGELGYKRSAKKCKEKFENVHKYYKRTKEGRAGRQDGKSYKFFSQLEALHATTSTANVSPAPTTSTAVTLTPNVIISSPPPFHPITYNHPLSSPPPPPSSQPFPFSSAAMSPVFPPNPATGFSSDSTSTSPISDEDYGGDGRKRKRDDDPKGGMAKGTRGMMEFFEGLMKQVMQKQEAMQQRFLEAVEKREQERMIRDEAWKRQEMARLAREHELMAQERAISASRDAAIISFLQKLTGQTIQLPQHLTTTPIPSPAAAPVPPPPAPASTPPPPQQVAIMVVPEQQVAPPAQERSGSAEASSSRWPKAEVLALINLRSGLEGRYQEAGPKGPLWEEVSAGMQRMGYKRSSKRCKEKWENINKYFKKVKESNKKRPEDAKTCPYFHQLDALYRKKSLMTGSTSFNNQNIVQQQQQQDQSLNSETVQATKTPQEPTQTNKNGGRLEAQTSSVAANLFGESTGGDTTQKPEDIVKDMMMGQRGQQLMVDDYDKINESDEDMGEEDDEEDDEDEVEDEERNKMEYKVEFQRPKTTGPSNGGGNETPSFLGMVQ